ncbi:MAG: CCA tRNA nucleotidyltransferase [Alphaproteobacteria bacterium]|nr:CCA tRNA nucleotidyltransferase [Alphaproteobacteria bacterium]
MLAPVRQMTPPAWMQALETIRVMAALKAEDGFPATLFVGGCVRNALLGAPVEDIDIATILPPETVMERLARAGIHVIPTGLAHGTVTAVLNGKSFEITTLRVDVETFGRRARVRYTDDWHADARRRDFTVNSLFADDGGYIYDPTGQGLSDLSARRIRFVGDPVTRIHEDYLRILRFFRFYAQYGKGEPDSDALLACRELADKLALISKERITAEFLKIVAVRDPVNTLEIMIENRIVPSLFGPGYDGAVMERLCGFQNRYDLCSLEARLVVIAGFSEGAFEHMTSALVLSLARQRSCRGLLTLLQKHDGLITAALSGESQTRILIYRYGDGLAVQALFLAAARGTDAHHLPDLLALVRSWTPPTFPLTGADLLTAGVPEGPAIGLAMKTAEDWWVSEDFQPDRSACLEKALSTA